MRRRHSKNVARKQTRAVETARNTKNILDQLEVEERVRLDVLLDENSLINDNSCNM